MKAVRLCHKSRKGPICKAAVVRKVKLANKMWLTVAGSIRLSLKVMGLFQGLGLLD